MVLGAAIKDSEIAVERHALTESYPVVRFGRLIKAVDDRGKRAAFLPDEAETALVQLQSMAKKFLKAARNAAATDGDKRTLVKGDKDPVIAARAPSVS